MCPRKPYERSDFFPYHVCNRSIDKNFYPLDLHAMWDKCNELLKILCWDYGANIHAFVLMSNHYHLEISNPGENLDVCMRYFQTELSRWIRKTTQKGIYCFNGKHHPSIIKDPQHYAEVYKYIYQNPVRAGLAKKVEDYRWSTIREKCGHDKLKFPLSQHEFHDAIPSAPNEELRWLNLNLEEIKLAKIRRGLRKNVFSPPRRLRHHLPSGQR